jgi:hypothetical protein
VVPDHVEVLRRHFLDLRFVVFRKLLSSNHFEHIRLVAAGQWRTARHSRGLQHARKRPDAREHLFNGRDRSRARLSEAGFGEVDQPRVHSGRQHIAMIDAQIHRDQPRKTRQEEACAHDEDDCERNLRDHEGRPHLVARSARCARAPAFFEGRLQVRPRQLERRYQAAD